MAYFPNGASGACFDEQCGRCRYGDGPCPIAVVQNLYNYEACNNKTARKILDALVKDNGSCAMFEHDPERFERESAAAPKETWRTTLDEISGVRVDDHA